VVKQREKKGEDPGSRKTTPKSRKGKFQYDLLCSKIKKSSVEIGEDMVSDIVTGTSEAIGRMSAKGRKPLPGC
jgi:hypothetical protein